MKNLLPSTETFNWIAMESIVGGHLRQIKDNLYSYISWSCHSSNGPVRLQRLANVCQCMKK